MDRADIVGELRAFGAVDGDVLTFESPLGPQHIDYLDLHPHGCHGGRPLGIDAVIRPNGRALLYIVRGRPSQGEQDALASSLAQRGEGEFVGFLQPGSLTVVPTARAHRELRAHHDALSPDARGLIPGLTFGTNDLRVEGADRVLHKALLALFNDSVKELTRVKVKPEDALSLVGRAMFFRFLIDRGFVEPEEAPAVAGGALHLSRAMATATSSRATLDWLDCTFNGHLLPLSDDAVARVTSATDGGAVRDQLTHILTRADARGQLSFDWAGLDFAHLPIGLLSEVYEDWAHTYDGDRAKREAAWYTPASIAQGIVRESLDAVSAPWDARVLDPSCGAGVFLAAAYRKLVQMNWEHTGKRPTRATVRRILEQQLTGLEVNDAALRLSALALYLTALELDPSPNPSARVPFPDLIEKGVLRDVRAKKDHERIRAHLPPIGSLGAHIDSSLEGRFHVVVGNPPWTRWGVSNPRVAESAQEVVSVVAPIVREHVRAADDSIGEHVEASDGADEEGIGAVDNGEDYAMTNGNPDVPFVWRASRWAVPDGVIALVLHARWLFQQTDQAAQRRREVLRGLTVSTIINGSALRKKDGVWAGQAAPFMILFARNRRPLKGECFRYLSPVEDDALNRRGRLRLDAAAAHPVSPVDAAAKPWLFKAMFRGTSFDQSVVEKVAAAGSNATLGEWWPDDFVGMGYQVAHEGGTPTVKMIDRANLEADVMLKAVVPAGDLPRFGLRHVRRPSFQSWREAHPEEVRADLAPRRFRAPLLVVRKIPRDPEVKGLAAWAGEDVVYSQSYVGLSAAWHAEPLGLSRYLLVFLSSSVMCHHLLMCSADWGVERGTLLPEDLRSLPIPPWEAVPVELRAKIDACAVTMLKRDRIDVGRCDRLVAELYGLSSADLECIRDTLTMALPGRKSTLAAQRAPSPKAVLSFIGRLSEVLKPLLAYSERSLQVRVETHGKDTPWQLLSLSTLIDGAGVSSPVLDEALQLATTEGASRVVVVGHPDARTIVVGVFRQARYWTLTQARALALHLLGDAEVMATLRGKGS